MKRAAGSAALQSVAGQRAGFRIYFFFAVFFAVFFAAGCFAAVFFAAGFLAAVFFLAVAMVYSFSKFATGFVCVRLSPHSRSIQVRVFFPSSDFSRRPWSP